ncbi:MAG: hypothetical protein ACRBBN_14345 [Methyloligellaceae bacterium]
MRRLMAAFGMAVLFVITTASSSFSASWEHLGTRKVDLAKDRDIVAVGRSKGKFRNLQFRVKGNHVYFKRVTIFFGNGSRQTLVLNQRVMEGAVSSPIDLKGDARYIKKIVFDYKRIANFRGRAFVSVYGREHGAFVPRQKWQQLGRQKVNLFRVDKDRIVVGRNKGRFRRLQIRVQGNDIFFKEMKITFGNGSTQILRLNENVREGTVSRAIDLKGRARFIKHIDLRYKRKLKTVFRGRAYVSVYGK